MKFKIVQTLQKIATLIDAKFVGDQDFLISGINEIHVVESGDIVLLSPACASYDMYENYKDRGNEYKSIVEEL